MSPRPPDTGEYDPEGTGAFNVELFHDFCRFSHEHLRAKDNDPIYPWFKRAFEMRDLDAEQRLWRLYLYTTFYHIGSAYCLWSKYDRPQPIPEPIDLPTGTERRCFRGQGDLARKNIKHAVDTGALDPDLWHSLEGEDGWRSARDQFESIPWNGPWASYKWADLLKHVEDVPITADDIGVGGNSETAGPIPGMVRITGLDWKTCATNVDAQKRLLTRANALGVGFNGLDQMETCLCDFNSARKGHYYIGHDIDLYGDQLEHLPAAYWEARAETFHPRFLGELHDWSGVRSELQRAYADDRLIRWWDGAYHHPGQTAQQDPPPLDLSNARDQEATP